MKQIQKRLVLLNDVQEIEKLALFMDEIGEELSLPSDLQFNLCLALEEAVTNVVLYAYPGQSGREIELEARSDARALVFVLTDAGIAFDPTQVPDADVNLSLEERPIGGLGIFHGRSILSAYGWEKPAAHEEGGRSLTDLVGNAGCITQFLSGKKDSTEMSSLSIRGRLRQLHSNRITTRNFRPGMFLTSLRQNRWS